MSKMTWSKDKKKAYGKAKSEASKTTWYENLAAGIRDNNIPWRKPWKGGATMPRNLKSKKPYRGGNIVALWFWGLGRGYTDLRFATRKQLYGRMHEFPTIKAHVERCVEKGVYDPEILNLYSDEEFEEEVALLLECGRWSLCG